MRKVRRNLLTRDIQGLESVLVVGLFLHRASQDLQDLDHDVHVLDLGQIAEDHRLIREERGRQTRQGGVLVAARLDTSLQRESAFYDVLVHAGIIVPGRRRSSATAGQAVGKLYFATHFGYLESVTR